MSRRSEIKLECALLRKEGRCIACNGPHDAKWAGLYCEDCELDQAQSLHSSLLLRYPELT